MNLRVELELSIGELCAVDKLLDERLWVLSANGVRVGGVRVERSVAQDSQARSGHRRRRVVLFASHASDKRRRARNQAAAHRPRELLDELLAFVDGPRERHAVPLACGEDRVSPLANGARHLLLDGPALSQRQLRQSQLQFAHYLAIGTSVAVVAQFLHQNQGGAAARIAAAALAHRLVAGRGLVEHAQHVAVRCATSANAVVVVVVVAAWWFGEAIELTTEQLDTCEHHIRLRVGCSDLAEARESPLLMLLLLGLRLILVAAHETHHVAASSKHSRGRQWRRRRGSGDAQLELHACRRVHAEAHVGEEGALDEARASEAPLLEVAEPHGRVVAATATAACRLACTKATALQRLVANDETRHEEKRRLAPIADRHVQTRRIDARPRGVGARRGLLGRRLTQRLAERRRWRE